MDESTIKKNLLAIQEARHQKAQAQKAKADALKQQWETTRQKLVQISSRFTSLEEEEQGSVCGESAGLLKELKQRVEECDAAFEEAQRELAALEVRYSRKTVNLVVVGAMGAGKSKFLQSASGLSDNYIPSYPGSSCTGVMSIIENSGAESREVAFSFKTRQEALEDMQREVQNLAQRLRAQQEISWNMPDFTTGVANLQKLKDIMHRPGQKIFSADYTREGSVERADLDELSALLELYDTRRQVWAPYLDGANVPSGELVEREEDGARVYVLYDPPGIGEYVSKHDEHNKRYYKYAAIKKAVIRTRLPGQIDAPIRLIDTVGIGDPSLDTEARIADAVRNDADGVIFLLKVESHRDRIKDQDYKLIETFQEIYQSYSGKEVDENGKLRREKRTKYWMTFVINELPFDNMPSGNGKRYLDKAIIPKFSSRDKLFSEEGIASKSVINAAKPQQVEKMLSDFLQQIADHLGEIDAGIEMSARLACAKAEAMEQALRTRLGNVHIAHNSNSKLAYLSGITITRLAAMNQALGAYAQSILDGQPGEDTPKSFLQQSLASVKDLIAGNELKDIPCGLDSEGVSLEKIIAYYETVYSSKSLRKHRSMARLAVFDELQTVIREIGSRSLETQKGAEAKFKSDIAQRLVQHLGLDCEKLGDRPMEKLDTEDPRFFKKVAEKLIDGLPYTQAVQKAFLSLDQFHLDSSNGITKALFCSLAPEYLCDKPYEVPEFPTDDEDGQELLLPELKQKLQSFCQAVEDRTQSEHYLVGEDQQMYCELENFSQIFTPIHRDKWQSIFSSLDDRNLLQDDTTRRSRLVTVAAVAEELDALLHTL